MVKVKDTVVILFGDLYRTNLVAEVEVSDLTWEQKEQVLRELFIRMNTRKSSMTDSTINAYVFNINFIIEFDCLFFSYRAHLPNDGHPIDDNSTNVFLTQTATNGNQTGTSSEQRSTTSSSSVPKLPQITSANST
jgi:hypothetical protein